MSSRRLALVVAALMIVSTATVAAPGTVDPAVPSDPGDRWIVGLADVERADLADGAWHGHPVVGVNQAIDFVVVEVNDPVAFHLEDRHRDAVDYVERDDPTAYKPLFTPNDPRYDEQYGFPQIQADDAWDTTLGSSSVNVSVIDTGIDQDHEDLQNTVVAQHDFASDDGEANDVCGHGTHVAGTVSANTDNGVGVAGTADGVNLIIAKALTNSLVVECTGSASDIADAITWSTDQGADVISMSLSGTSSSSSIGEAVDYAWERGVLLVAAAGNSGPCTDCVSFPAARERVVAVTCTTEGRDQCSFSSQGPEAELAAPGNDVLSTYLDDDYREISGTSMSAPHVSGTAALALSVDGTLTNSELRDLMNQTARDLGDAGHDNRFGHGEVDAAALLDAVAAQDTNDAPQASFDATCSELNCTFDAGDSLDPDGAIASYDWTLGDGSTAQGEVVDHTYDSEGTYDVELTVTDDEGATDTATQTIEVQTASDGVLLDEDFDDGTADGFTLGGLWHVSDACAQPPTTPNYLGYNQDSTCSYDTGSATSGSATVTVDLSSASQPSLAFEHRWETESTSCGLLSCEGYDHMRVEVGQNGDWTTLDEWTSLDDNQLSWTAASYDLGSFATGTADLRFTFDTRDDVDNDYEGWFVDNVTVTDSG